MKKSIIALALASIILLAVAGCGKDSTETPTDEAVSAAEAVDAETAMPDEQDKPDDTASSADAVREEDFSIWDLGDGTCEIRSCEAYEAKAIQVPETISGRTVVGIGQFGLSGLDAESIVLPDTVEYIESYAFINDVNLISVSLGSGLTRAEEMIFSGCDKLETVTFPEGMSTMSYMPFGTCDVLEEVYIPASVTEIPNGITYIEKCPNIVIVTPAGSTAEAVANEYGLPVVNS